VWFCALAVLGCQYDDAMCHSGPGVGVGSLKSLTRFEEQFRQWLVTHACGVWLCV